MGDKDARLVEFEKLWRAKFNDEHVPRLTCFEDDTSDEVSMRKGVQVALDYHNLRIGDLQKKLQKEQFILEYLAQELEKMPVPRQSSSTPPATDKPVPSPRSRKLPPPTAKKPSFKSGDGAGPGVIRRNKSTPNPRHAGAPEKRLQFNSAIIPHSGSLEEVSPTQEQFQDIAIKTPALTPTNSIAADEAEVADERFKSFQGSTFGSRSPSQISRQSSHSGTSSPLTVSADTESTETPGSTLEASPSVIIGMKSDSIDDDIIAAPSPARVARNSMKNMDRISIEDPHSAASSDSSPDDTSDYMQLWNIHKPTTSQVKRSSSQASNESNNKGADDNPDDSSAASIKSSNGGAITKKSSRMVKVDYSSKNGGPQPLRDPNSNNDNDNQVESSDDEDDQPQYVRLMYKSCYSNLGRYHIDTDSVHSNDSTDSPPSAMSNSLAAKYRYKGRQRQTMFFDSDWSLDKIESKVRAASEGDSDLAIRPSLQTDESQDDATQGSENESNLQMRNWVVNSVLESEKSYIDDLNVLLRYKKSLELAAQTSMPMISVPDINAIFGNLQQIHEIHSRFRQELEPIIAKWTHHSEVGTLFKEMAVNLEYYNTYLENYPNAIATVKKCCTENTPFNDLVTEIKCPSTQEMMHLEAILHKPINRMQRNSLLLQDMIQCTPPSHPDHKMFQNALKLSQHFLRDQMKVSSTGNDKAPLHVLVRNQLLVEYVRGKARKLRHIFLFNDIVICTKCVIVKGGKQQYEVKWYIPLCDIELSDKMDDTPVEWKQKVIKAEKEIQTMKSKLRDLKAQLRKAIKECKDKDIEINSSTKIQRLTRTIQEQESILILAEPRLRFTISTKKGDQYCFLLPSDYERREWQESLQSLKAKLPHESKPKVISLLDAQSIVDTCKDNVHLNNVGQMVMKEASDEDIVSGQLTITIHKMLGLQDTCETFTAIEVDSFSHFYLKAKTPIKGSDSPVWNESFAIDLESSSTLRLICYKHTDTGDVLLGKSSLKLSKQWLKQGFQEKELSMNEVTLTVSIKYQTAEQTIRRLPSRIESGIFGVKLSSTCNKEGLKVPAFVTAAIEDVEKRGIDEMGIYRVSGTTTDVQRIRKAFDKSARIGKSLLPDVEINAVTGALKLYLRELPEAVITDALYPEIVETYKMQDKEEQEKKMITLLGSLPDPNYYTMMAILEHLIRIRHHEDKNKMPFHNLAVVFGPTLLKPAEKAQPLNPMDLFSSGANDAMYQSGILFYYLTLLSKGVQFR